MSFGTPTSAPQQGRLFLRSHGDCFIHATQWWLRYWNYSISKEQLAIVRVSLLTGENFLATLSPVAIPYENVQKGVKRRQYLEIDPKFAVELKIMPDTEVIIESIGAVEDCNFLVLAPVVASDYDKLENFSEKIDYELTERIRVVSCNYSFPVWIDNLVVSIKVVKSDPTASWVMLVPGHTRVQIQRDALSPSATSGTSVLSTPGPVSSGPENPLHTDSSTTSTLSYPPMQQTANRHWDFSSSYNHTKAVSKKSTSSSRSNTSTSGSSVDASPTEEENLDKFNQSLVSFSDLMSTVGQTFGQWKNKLFSRESSQVDSDERPAKLELGDGKYSFASSMESVGFEPQRCLPKVSLQEVSDRQYPIQEEGLVTRQPSVQQFSARQQPPPQQKLSPPQPPSTHKQLMGEILQKVPRSGSPRRQPGSHSSSLVPAPSVSSGSEPGDKAKKTGVFHQRYNTWHSSSDFLQYKNGSRDTIGSGPPPLPQLSAKVRVQPHEISGVCFKPYSKAESSVSREKAWSQEQLFDVFVHPSTIPEVFLYWESLSTVPFPVEIVPVNPLTSDPKEGRSAVVQDDLNELKATETQSTSSTIPPSSVSPLPSSLVVRLCFATKIRVVNGRLIGSIEETPTAQETDAEREGPEVSVNVGHVLMSDTLRQQLRVKTCSPVKLLHVFDSWRIPYTDKPSLNIQLLNSEHKKHSVTIKNGLEAWIKAVHDQSKMDPMLVEKQIIPVFLEEQGIWVSCLIKKIDRNQTRRISSRVRTQYLMVSPSDIEKHRLPLHVEGSTSNSGIPFRTKAVMSRVIREPSPSREEITLPAMHRLNQPSVLEDIQYFRALEHLYREGVQFLEIVFSQAGRNGALLVCGVSGSGGSGCGKTTLAKLLCKAVSGHPRYANLTFIDCTAYRGLTTHNFKKRLLMHFTEAIDNQPSVILLDDMDHTMPQVSDAQEQVGEEGNASIRKSQVLLEMLKLIERNKAQVVVIATAQNKQQLNKDLLQSRGVHVFQKILEITPPTLTDRKVILSSILAVKALNMLTDQELRTVAERTEGFQPGDLVTLVDKAVSLCELRTLYPQQGVVGPYTPSSPDRSLKWPRVGRVAIDSGGDFDLSSSPVKQSPLTRSMSPSFPTPPSSPLKKHVFRNPPDKNPSVKKMSVVSSESTHTLIPDSIDHTFHHLTSLSQMTLNASDFLNALKGFVPLSLRGLPLHKSGSIDFSGVGGLQTVKKSLKETLLWPSKYPRLFGQCPIKQRCGVLLYGAPGTGKTMLAGAVAKEFNLNFVSIKGPELLSKYIGASEQAVRDVFSRALCAKPCILFFDEFDSLAPRRGHDNTGVTDRVVNQLLTQLDGVEVLQGVYVLAASSRPDLIDPALLRPGRIDRNLLCGMPTEDERTEILVSLSRKMPLAPNVNLKEIASKATGMTGADLKAVLYSAQLQAAHESLTSKQGSREPSLTDSLEVDSLNTSRRGSSVVSEIESSLKRPLVFNFAEGSVRRMGQVSSSVESKTSALQQKGSFVVLSRQRRRRSTLTREIASDGSLFDKKKKRSVLITQEHLLSGLNQVQPSLSKDELKKFNQIYDKFAGKTKTTLENIKPVATMA